MTNLFHFLLREPVVNLYVLLVVLTIAVVIFEYKKRAIFNRSNKGSKDLHGPWQIPIVGNVWQIKWILFQNVLQPFLIRYQKMHSHCLLYCSGKKSWIHSFLAKILDMMEPEYPCFVQSFVKAVTTEWSQYGGVCRIWLLDQLYIVVMIPEYVEQIIGDVRQVQKSTDYNILADSPLGGGLISQMDDATWRFHRKIITPAFHFNNLKMYIPVFHEETNILLAKLERNFTKPYSRDIAIADAVPLFKLNTFDMILRCIFGVRIHAQAQESHEMLEALHDAYLIIQYRLFNPLMFLDLFYTLSGYKARMERAKKYCREFTDSVIQQKRLELQNIDQKNSKKKLDDNDIAGNTNEEEIYSVDNEMNSGKISKANTGKDPKIEKSSKKYTINNGATYLGKDITNVNIDKHSTSSSNSNSNDSTPSRLNSTSTMGHTSGKQDNARRNHKSVTPEEEDPVDIEYSYKKNYKTFLELIIEDEVNQRKKMTDEEIRDSMITLVFAGLDTTANMTSLCLLMLATHQDILEKTLKEIDSVFGGPDVDDGHTPSYSELMELELLDRVIKESTRLYPVAPMIGKGVKEDTPMGPFILPKGSIMLFTLMSLHRDPRYHPRPNEFWPDRFLPPNTMTKFSYIPFSAGSRNCVGQRFAMIQMKVVLSTMLRKYRVSTDPSYRSVSDVDNLINMSLTISVRSCPLILKPRNY